MTNPKQKPKDSQSHQNALRAIRASVDWITLTASAEGSGGQLWATGDRLLREHQGIGDCAVPWQMKGYRGWSTTGVRLGSRPAGTILSMSGAECSENWRNALMTAENCSRLDLAVDVDCNPVVPQLALNIYKELGHRRLRTGRPVSSRLIMGSDGGSTVYIGSRVSELFGRVYDKGIEQETAPRGQWWRWELELKGEAAKREAAQLLAAESAAVRSLQVVADFFRSRTGYAPIATEPLVKHLERRDPTSTDQKLHWLSSQVRPTVQQLIGIVGRSRVLDVLGIPQSAVSPYENPEQGGSYASGSGRPLADDAEHAAARPAISERHHDA